MSFYLKHCRGRTPLSEAPVGSLHAAPHADTIWGSGFRGTNPFPALPWGGGGLQHCTAQAVRLLNNSSKIMVFSSFSRHLQPSRDVLSPDLGGNQEGRHPALASRASCGCGEKLSLYTGSICTGLCWMNTSHPGKWKPSGRMQAIPVNASHLGEHEPSPMGAAVRGSAGGAPCTSRGLLAGWLSAAEPSGS